MIIVLKRFCVGEADVLARVYGYGGIMNLYIKDGYEPSNKFFGVFEPFNIMEITYYQQGEFIIPQDIRKIERLSFLARNYDSFLWMCSIADFILNYIKFFEATIFNKTAEYLKFVPSKYSRYSTFIKFIFEIIEILGITPAFLSEEREGNSIYMKDGSINEKGDYKISMSAINVMRKIYRTSKVERIKVEKDIYREITEFLKRYIEFHIS